MTNDLIRCVYEHREGLADGYTSKHQIKRPVQFDVHETVSLAIRREKTLKHWVPAWKLALIEARNAEWRDLWDEIVR